MFWTVWLAVLFGFLIGHPWLVLLVIALAWWGFDRAWIGAWNGPRRALRRRRDLARLRTRLAVNPNDRDARHGVAEWLVSKGRCDEALALVEQNLAAGDDDVDTLLLAGKAAFGSSRPQADEQAVEWLGTARERASNLRRPVIDLELGRGFSRHRRWAEARDALELHCAAQPGSVEGRVLLARAHAELGDAAASTRERAEAWASYRAKPPFQRRRERPWAWRAKPSAAVAYFGVAAIVIAGCGWVAISIGRELALSLATPYDEFDLAYVDDIAEEAWNVDVPAPAPTRYERRQAQREPHRRELVRVRSDLNGNRATDMRRKVTAGDFVCRLPASFGPPQYGEELEDEIGSDIPFAQWVLLDRELDVDIVVRAMPFEIQYTADARDLETAEASMFAFEAMIEAHSLRDCTVRLGMLGPRVGVRDGAAFYDPG